MYWLKPGIKEHPEKRWALPDRAFFGFGACHILAGVFLKETSQPGFCAEWIVPRGDFRGSHIYVTNGAVTFDCRGYAETGRLLEHYSAGCAARFPGWDADVVRVDFDLLDTKALNKIKHRGPDQYFDDPIRRARRFIAEKPVPERLRALM